MTLGNFPKVSKERPAKKLFATEFIYCKPGIFERLENFDLLEKQGVISDYYCFKSKGSEFDTVENSGDRIAGFSIIGETAEEINQKHKVAVEKLAVIDSCGEDMMRRDLLPLVY